MARVRLRNERYEYIKRAVIRTLKECNIGTIPICPFLICKIRGYKLVKYTDKYTKEEMKIVCRELSDGFNYVLNGERIIEYNDTKLPERIRTTIFHEIGHIELKHTCRCSLSEAEAEWFGAYMIAPPPLVDLFNLDDFTDLAVKFNTSVECAYYSMNRYMKWKKYTWFLKDYEKELVKLFSENDKLFIKREEVMQN